MTNKISPFGHETQKYWDLRYDLFSKFDQGIKVDKEGLFSVKPEKEAEKIAEKIKGNIVLDAFGGLGGSAIAFAKAGKNVLCIEKSLDRLILAKNNARVYGVIDKIEFIHGDCTKLFNKLSYDAVYFDPPWGGINYHKKDRFGLVDFEPNGKELFKNSIDKKLFTAITVPNNFDYNEIIRYQFDFEVYFSKTNLRTLFSTIFIDFGK